MPHSRPSEGGGGRGGGHPGHGGGGGPSLQFGVLHGDPGLAALVAARPLTVAVGAARTPLQSPPSSPSLDAHMQSPPRRQPRLTHGTVVHESKPLHLFISRAGGLASHHHVSPSTQCYMFSGVCEPSRPDQAIQTQATSEGHNLQCLKSQTLSITCTRTVLPSFIETSSRNILHQGIDKFLLTSFGIAKVVDTGLAPATPDILKPGLPCAGVSRSSFPAAP